MIVCTKHSYGGPHACPYCALEEATELLDWWVREWDVHWMPQRLLDATLAWKDKQGPGAGERESAVEYAERVHPTPGRSGK